MTTLLKVLLVEDDQNDAELILHELKKNGYEPEYTRVQTREEFLEHLLPSLDIILADYSLPGFTGLDALLLAKERFPAIPLIIITGALGDERATEVMKHGADDFLLKDRLARLGEAVGHSLQQRDMVRKQREQESVIHESEEKYRILFENMLEGFAYCRMIYDGEGRPSDFIYLAVNASFNRIVARPEVTGRRATEVFPGIRDAYPALFETYGRIAMGGTPEVFDIDFIPIGKWLHISAYSPAKDYFVAVFEDITARKRAEEALLASEESFRALAENASDAFLVASGSGIHLFANKRAAEITGYSIEELVTLSVKELAEPGEFERVIKERFRKVMAGEAVPNPYETTIVRKDGEKLPIEVTSAKTMWQGQPVDLVVFRDISARKHAGQVTLLTNRIYGAAHRAGSLQDMLDGLVDEFMAFSGCEAVGIRLLDGDGNIPYQAHKGFPMPFYESETPLSIKSDECMCIYVIKGTINPALPVATPNGSFWCNGTSRFLATVPEEEKGHTRNVCNAMGYESVALIPIRTPAGILGLVQFNDHRENMVPLDMVRTMEEVTRPLGEVIRRKQAEEEIRKSETRFHALFDAAPEAMLIADPETLRLVLANPAASEQTGYTEQELLGLSVPDLIPPDQRSATLDQFRQHKQRERTTSSDMPILRKDGTIYYADISSAPITLQNGQYLLGIVRDVTSRKLMESEIRSLNTVLEQRVAERTAQLNKSLLEKEILLKEVHHRVKNNLQIIISLLRLQKHQIADTAALHHLVDSESRIRSMAIVHEKLYRSTDLKSIDFDDYLKTLVNQLILMYEINKGQVRISVDMKGITVDINQAIPLGLIMNELVSNAMKHAFPEGKSGEIIIRGSCEKDSMVFIVRDTGAGIPVDFDWKNTKTLGLNIVNMLTDQLGGTVELERDGGTLFRITIPA
ncbi:MAG: PAS domain S-box protein [Methanoregula sp.]